MFYIVSLILLVFGAIMHNDMMLIAAGLFAIGGAIEIHK